MDVRKWRRWRRWRRWRKCRKCRRCKKYRKEVCKKDGQECEKKGFYIVGEASLPRLTSCSDMECHVLREE